MPDCSSQDKGYSSIGLFPIGSKAFGQGSSPWSLVRGANLKDELEPHHLLKQRNILVSKASKNYGQEFSCGCVWGMICKVHDLIAQSIGVEGSTSSTFFSSLTASNLMTFALSSLLIPSNLRKVYSQLDARISLCIQFISRGQIQPSWLQVSIPAAGQLL